VEFEQWKVGTGLAEKKGEGFSSGILNNVLGSVASAVVIARDTMRTTV
jgi:hypothetical protein